MPFTVFNSHLIFIWTCTSKRGGQKVLAIKMHTNCLILNVPFIADFAVRAFLKITFLQGGNCFIYNLFWPLDTQTMQYLYKNNLFFVQSPSQTTNWKPKRDCFYLFFFFCMLEKPKRKCQMFQKRVAIVSQTCVLSIIGVYRMKKHIWTIFRASVQNGAANLDERKKAKSLGFYSNWKTFYRLFFGVLDHLYRIFQLCEWPSFFHTKGSN